jgi:predicted alpha/beta superfamily hydrolase
MISALDSHADLLAIHPTRNKRCSLSRAAEESGHSIWSTMRYRDFTPARPTDDYSKQHTYAKALDNTGGAGRFVSFLKDELIPHIESAYPVDSSRRGFLGYSLGSLLGAYILTKDPQLFQYYLIGSPSIWYNEYTLALEFEKAPAKDLESVKRIYLSVGDQESWEMLKGFGILRDALKEKGFEGPRAKAEIIRDAGHVGAMPIALYNGLRFLFRGR